MLLHLTKLPGFARFHAELFHPPEEHDKNEDEFAGIAPPPSKAGPPVSAQPVRADLPTAAVAHGESHVSISAAERYTEKCQLPEGCGLQLLSYTLFNCMLFPF